MKITHIKLKNFRNHRFYQCEPHHGLNILYGDNGKGKTAILEAISLLMTGKSFKSGKNWIKDGEVEAYASLNFENENGQGNIEIFLKDQIKPCFFLNGKIKTNHPFQHQCIFFLSDDLFAIRGEASYRRKLIDDLVISTRQGQKILQNFKKILNQKNRFLKLCKQGLYNQKDQSIYLQSVNQSFLEKSIDLIDFRIKQIKKIQPYWKKQGVRFLKTTAFYVQYVNRQGEVMESREKAVNILKKEMADKAVLENLQGICLAGPQRHDLQFFAYDKEARWSLSQGQQRALLLSWKMAHWESLFFEHGEPPIFFLDDVFSEIDQHFRKNLLEFLIENKGQNFITSSSLFEMQAKSLTQKNRDTNLEIIEL